MSAAIDTQVSDRLFVYGTLLPGQAPPAMRDVVDRLRPVGTAAVRGRLYDLGAYPGMVLDPAAGDVLGRVLELPPPSGPSDAPSAADLWRRMDAYEGFVPDAPSRSLFRRVRCQAILRYGGAKDGADARPVDCWTYVYNGTADESRRISAGVWRADPARPIPTEQPEVTHPNPPASSPTSSTSSRRRPAIGVTLGTADGKARYELPFDYAASIERAGGLPLAIPYRTDLTLIPDIVDRLDGVLFTGGDDLDPALYGETYHPNAEPVDPDRQRFELALMAEVERRRVPALGVCLGSQLMNVYRGGSLIQFLPEFERQGGLEHRKLDDDGRRHPVRIEPGTVLHAAIGRDEVVANTRHKQAIRRVGRGLRVNAVAPDGVIEGIEDPTLPLFLAVQWHPENLSTAAEHLAPFRLLVERAGGSLGR